MSDHPIQIITGRTGDDSVQIHEPYLRLKRCKSSSLISERLPVPDSFKRRFERDFFFSGSATTVATRSRRLTAMWWRAMDVRLVSLSQLVNTFWRNMALPCDSRPIFLPSYEQY